MRARVRWIVVLGALGAFGGGLLRAQEELELDLFRPRVDVAFDRTASRPFEDVSGDYGTHSESLSALVPLGGTHLRPGRDLLGYQLFAQAELATASPGISFLARQRRLETGALRFSGLFLGRSKNLYWGSIGASVAEDEETIHDAKARFSAIGLGTHRLSGRVLLLYGGAFTHQFGRGLALPLFGAIWTLDPKWTLTGALPFSVVARYRWRRDLDLRLRLTVAGNRYRVSNQGDFPGEPQTVFLRLVQTQMLGEVDWRAGRNVALLAQAGVVRTRKLAFANGNDDFIETGVRPAGYLKLAARFSFGRTLLDQWRP
ncbi:MAG TPA: hypothetical protein VFT43_04500 [Candidatus Polarisedimenticolia bacterium]|nr:hypothetical protein [Candidatus Polarisedimenticolia bacterium]